MRILWKEKGSDRISVCVNIKKKTLGTSAHIHSIHCASLLGLQ